ncbi:MAG: hypothetical protein JXR65_06880 [Bacteroidales bacterium]|nr:hypothetical protein [Bacteroidales bacterium]
MKRTLLFIVGIIMSLSVFAQQFEAPQIDENPFNKVKVKVGADFALQFQALTQNADSLIVPIGKGFNLPTANMNISAMLAPGIKVHVSVYLSSKHHTETWVKGGYLIIDRLPIKGTENFMKYLTFKAGVMELNYGDAHFFRSDNGNVIHNPFVGNLIMDAFTTAPALEIYSRKNGFTVMIGATTGTLKPSIASYSSYTGYSANNQLDQLAFYSKIAYDKTFDNDLRFRVSLSAYTCKKNSFGSLYHGDRTGSRFYLVMVPETNSSTDVDPSSQAFTGRWDMGFTDKDNSLMFNAFMKYKGLELFGTLEKAKGTTAFTHKDFDMNQYEFNAQYYFGSNQNFYVGGKINGVSGDDGTGVNKKVSRFEGALGWFFTKNIIIKLDYVNQKYTDFAQYGNNAGFKGIMFEAGISF